MDSASLTRIYFIPNLIQGFLRHISYSRKPRDVLCMLPQRFTGTCKSQDIVEIQPELNLSLPAADTDANIILTKLENMRQAEEVKCILSANDTEFKTNFENLIKQTQTIGIETVNNELNANMAKLSK